MSFYTSLSGLKAAQTDLSAISNNIANVGSTGFKKSRAEFGDMFASAPTQTTKMVAGQGTRLNGIKQQFTQGTLEGSNVQPVVEISRMIDVMRAYQATATMTKSQEDLLRQAIDKLGATPGS